MRALFVLVSVGLVALAARAQPSPGTIAVFDAPGVGEEALATAIAAIEAAGMTARVLGPDEVRAGALEGASAVLFTGGRGSVQGRLLGEDGRERVRAFVRSGGGYVGICAGAYLALQREPEFHKLAIVAGRHATGDAWIRGIGPAEVVPTDGSAAVTMHYANGPLVAAEAVEGLPAFTTLATFATEYAVEEEGTHRGEMLGAPAAVASSYGEGAIVLFSPNPTLDPAVPELLVRALERVSRREHAGSGAPRPVGSPSWSVLLGPAGS